MYEIKFLESSSLSSSSFKNYKAENILQMFHLTNLQNAKKILTEGFNPQLSKVGAFGLGINLSTTIEDLEHYFDENNNILLTCLVKFNKKKENFSKRNKNYWNKYHSTKPNFITPPPGFDALFSENIYVIPKKEQVYPILISEIKFY